MSQQSKWMKIDNFTSPWVVVNWITVATIDAAQNSKTDKGFNGWRLNNNIIIFFVSSSAQALEQAKRYDGLSNQCKSVSGPQDLSCFVRVLPLPPMPTRVPRKAFAPPQPPVPAEGEDNPEYNVIIVEIRWALSINRVVIVPFFSSALPTVKDGTLPLKDELVADRCASIQVRPSLEALKREAADLESQIRQLQVCVGRTDWVIFGVIIVTYLNLRIPWMHHFVHNCGAWRVNCTTRRMNCRKTFPWRSLTSGQNRSIWLQCEHK